MELKRNLSVEKDYRALGPATLLKKRLWYRCFPVNFPKFIRTSFLQNTPGRLLLVLVQFTFTTSDADFDYHHWDCTY